MHRILEARRRIQDYSIQAMPYHTQFKDHAKQKTGDSNSVAAVRSGGLQTKAALAARENALSFTLILMVLKGPLQLAFVPAACRRFCFSVIRGASGLVLFNKVLRATHLCVVHASRPNKSVLCLAFKQRSTSRQLNCWVNCSCFSVYRHIQSHTRHAYVHANP